MSYEIHADYQQQWLLPMSVEDWVGPDHPARFIRDFVSVMDLSAAGFTEGAEATGRPRYASELLVKVWLYGYMHGLRSSRRLEQACREHMGLIWLTGRHEPDHNTLWRFWQANRAALRRLFKRSVQVAVRNDLVGLVVHAVDGTKIAARAGRRGIWSRKRLERVVAELDAAVTEVMETIEAAEAQEKGSYRLPPEWQDTVRRREELSELLGQLEAEEREQGALPEPEARLMRTARGVVPAYNAQLAVDETSELIVAQSVVTEPDDTYQLSAMLDAVEETVGAVAADTVADGGYHAPAALATLAARGRSVVVNEGAQHAPAPGTPGTEYHTSRFTYDRARNGCVCPRKELLPFERVRAPRGQRGAMRVYRCQSFRQCPVRWQCSREAHGRTVEIGEHHEAVVAQRLKRAQPEAAARLRRRCAIVEGPLGIIKTIMGFTRWTVAGPENVRTQWALLCTGFNLRKLYRWWYIGRLQFA